MDRTTRDRRDRLLREVRASPAARLELAELYRSLGHLDQAGRWGISEDGWSLSSEREAYASLIRQRRPDAETLLRRFSGLGASEALTGDARAVLEQASIVYVAAPRIAGTRSQLDLVSRWTSGVVAAMGAVILVVMMVGLFIAAFAGEQDLRMPARVAVAVCALCFGLAAVFRLPASILRQQWLRVALLTVAVAALGAAVATLAPAP